VILHEFPDLQWLKQQIDQRFQNRVGYGNRPLDTEGFPNVIIHTTTTTSYRPDILGPISVFQNIIGSSRCKVDNHTVNIPPDYFFISNCFQEYTLEIESTQPVETFNIHIGDAFSQGTLSALLTPTDTILNHGLQQQVPTIAFYNKLYRKDAAFNTIVKRLQQHQAGSFEKAAFEEDMTRLLVYLLQQHRDIIAQLHKLPPVKKSTKLELYKRLSVALDAIYTHPVSSLDIDALAATACLSKFHFLRLFKQAYGLSPYQYMQQLRLEKAAQLLKHTSFPVLDIAITLGFENSNSFSRLFYQRHHCYPTQYRAFVK
jgi:AraC family transcriptional regulator